MSALHTILLILALVFFLVAGVVGYTVPADGARVVGWHRANYVAVGLAFWVASELLTALRI